MGVTRPNSHRSIRGRRARAPKERSARGASAIFPPHDLPSPYVISPASIGISARSSLDVASRPSPSVVITRFDTWLSHRAPSRRKPAVSTSRIKRFRSLAATRSLAAACASGTTSRGKRNSVRRMARCFTTDRSSYNARSTSATVTPSTCARRRENTVAGSVVCRHTTAARRIGHTARVRIRRQPVPTRRLRSAFRSTDRLHAPLVRESVLAEGVGFEPTETRASTVFKTSLPLDAWSALWITVTDRSVVGAWLLILGRLDSVSRRRGHLQSRLALRAGRSRAAGFSWVGVGPIRLARWLRGSRRRLRRRRLVRNGRSCVCGGMCSLGCCDIWRHGNAARRRMWRRRPGCGLLATWQVFAAVRSSFGRGCSRSRGHALIDWQRRGQRRPVVAEGSEDVADPEWRNDPADEAIERLETERALRLIRRLPDDQADVILLRVVAGLDAARVGKILGKKPGAVRVLQHRGLRRLAELVGSSDWVDQGVTQ